MFVPLKPFKPKGKYEEKAAWKQQFSIHQPNNFMANNQCHFCSLLLLIRSLPMAQFSTLYFTFQLMRLKRHSRRFYSLHFSADEASRFHPPIERNTKGQFWTFWTMRNGDYFSIALLKMHYIRFGRCLLLLKKRNECVALESFGGFNNTYFLVSTILFLRSRSLSLSIYDTRQSKYFPSPRVVGLHTIYNKDGDDVVVVVVFYAIEEFSFCLNRLWADCKS